MQYDSTYTAQQTDFTSAQDEKPKVERDILQYTGNPDKEFSTIIGTLLNDNKWKQDKKFLGYWSSWCQLQTTINQQKPAAEQTEASRAEAQAKFDEITLYIQDLANKKRALNLQFYKKYSRFLQEGSWIKEDYVDHNLYYLDSESTLHTSAQPKVTYNISVVDLSSLEDYKGYEFDIGDKTFIEDVEFFGWSQIDGTTPYREEIIVSEITTELDSPEKNQIKVQNYKTQFEDLFQRITAATQQAEYHTGEYNRAAAVVESNGSIRADILANSFANNELRLANARDQSVVWDETGITTWSPSNPSERVRIISGGIFLSTDGGDSWKTGITGQGINTSYLTAGQLNVDEIYIMSGSHASFGWDSRGLSAYYYNVNAEGKPINFNTNQFVRFDHHGIYGIKNGDGIKLDSEDDVWSNAHFALTWKGFMLKNDEGSVQITSDNDIQVVDTNGYDRIKIGRLEKDSSGNGTRYGIRIKDANNATVMETADNGKLWLRKELNVETTSTSAVQLGYLDYCRPNTDKHAVIRAGDINQDSREPGFVVYEDGVMKASGVEISGKINATEGTIGNLTVEAVEKAAYEVIITSSIGNSMLEGATTTLKAELYMGGAPYSGSEVLSYQWYEGNNPTDGAIADAVGQEFTIPAVDFENGYVEYGCVISITDSSSTEQKEEDNDI